MSNRQPFGLDEWYHRYSRGVDKRAVFENKNDYGRFVQLLYLLNSDKPIHRSDLFKKKHYEILSHKKGEPIVAIACYSLMKNHFHILIKEVSEGGISKFMRILGIAYAMYFNIKNDRVGNLFVKPFRSRHVDTDRYFKYVVQYIHLNIAETFEPKWKDGGIKDLNALEKNLLRYQYSSLPDYTGITRPENSILDKETVLWLQKELPALKKVIPEAIEYYKKLSR
mgnify:CR=1 FL=1